MARGFGTTVTVDAAAQDRVSRPMENAKKATKGLFDQMGLLSGGLGNFGATAGLLPGMLGPAAASIGALSAALGPVAIAIGIVVAAIGGMNAIIQQSTALVNESTDSFAAYERKLAEVQTVLGVTRKEMEGITDVALRYAGTYGKPAQEQLEGFYETASSGFADAARSAVIMNTANKLAVAGVTDLQSSVKLLTGILNGYGMAASDAESVSDALFIAVQRGVTTVPELASSMGQLVPSASAAGASLEESLSAVAALTLAGQSTAEATTAMARAFDFLTKKPEGAMKVMAEYGLEADKLSIRERGLLPVLQDIAKAFEGNEEALIKAFPEIRAFKAILPLTGAQMDAFKGSLDAMGNRLGTTDAAFGTIADTLSFQRERWTSMVEAIKVRLGGVFAPAIRRALDIMNDLLGLIEKLPPGMKNAIFTFAGLGLALPTVVGKLTSFVWAALKVGAALAVVVAILSAIGPALGPMGLALGPMIGRVVKFAVAWRENLGSIQDRVKQWGENVKMTIQGLGEAIANKGYIRGPLAKELDKSGLLPWVGKIYAIFERLRTFMEAIWSGFSEAVLGGAESLGDAFPELQALIDIFKDGGDGAADMGKKLPIEAFKELGKSVGKAAGDVVRFIADFGMAWEDNKAIIETVVDTLRVLADVIQTIMPIVKVLWAILKPMLEFTGGFISGITGAKIEVYRPEELEAARKEGRAPEAEIATAAGGATGVAGRVIRGFAAGLIPGGGVPGIARAGGRIVVQIRNVMEVDKAKLAEKVTEANVEIGQESFEPFAQPQSVME